MKSRVIVNRNWKVEWERNDGKRRGQYPNSTAGQ
jgi:hypothetical protein